MKRLALFMLLLAAGGSANGCRSCQSPYDYTSPVANCSCASCNACGGGRAGSVLSDGYASTPYDYAEPGLEYADSDAQYELTPHEEVPGELATE